MTIRKRTADVPKDILVPFKDEIKNARKHPAKIIDYENYDENSLLKCDVCDKPISRPALCSPKCRTRAFRARRDSKRVKHSDFCKHGSKPGLCKFGCIK